MGKVIKISTDVVKKLDKLKHIGQSYDGVLRELLGLDKKQVDKDTKCKD